MWKANIDTHAAQCNCYIVCLIAQTCIKHFYDELLLCFVAFDIFTSICHLPAICDDLSAYWSVKLTQDTHHK